MYAITTEKIELRPNLGAIVGDLKTRLTPVFVSKKIKNLPKIRGALPIQGVTLKLKTY